MRASRLASATAEALPERMRAVLVPSFGAPAVLRLADDLPLPRLEAHEVLVRVGAAGVNPLDCRVRAGYGRSLFGPLLPLVLGREFCGRVASLGAGVRDVVLGSRVFGALSPLVPRGSHARYVAVPACDLAPVPETWSDAHAASLPFAALTAWRALHGGDPNPRIVALHVSNGTTLELHVLPTGKAVLVLLPFEHASHVLWHSMKDGTRLWLLQGLLKTHAAAA